MYVRYLQKFADKNALIINVFGLEDDQLSVYHTNSKLYNSNQKVIYLLLYNNHYVWVKKIETLMFSQTKQQAKKIYMFK